MSVVREDTRVCKTCGKEKPIEAFRICGRTGKGKPYRQRDCRDCVNGKEKKSPVDYICVHDPSGTYAGDSALTKGQIRNSLLVGYMPPGSTWRHSVTKEIYIVKGNEHWHNLLECVKKPDESYLESVREKQRMVRI
jgi:hypothetical protein